MQRTLSIAHRLPFVPVVLALATVGAHHCAAQTRVTEITGLIGARHHAGPMAFSPDGKTLALPMKEDGRVALWSMDTGRPRILRSSLNRDEAPADSLAFSRDGHCLAVEHRQVGITVWNLDSGKEQAHVPMGSPARSGVSGMAFASGHRMLVAILLNAPGPEHPDRWEQSAIRWKIETDKKVEGLAFDPSLSFKAISPNGHYAVLQHRSGQDIFDLVEGQKVCSIDDNGGFVFSEDGSKLFVMYRDHLSVWEIPSGRRLKHLVFDPPHEGFYTSTGHLALSPDTKVMAVSVFEGKKNLVGLVSVESGKVLEELESCPFGMISNFVVFSPDGRVLATDTYATNSRDLPVDPLLRLWRLPPSW